MVCKDDDRLHIERVDYDADAAIALIAKAQRVIDAPEPPERIGAADYFECKWCDHYQTCHQTKAPAVNCRTCAHSTPQSNGTWSCEGSGAVLSVEDQKSGCIEHRYIPATIKHWAEVVRADHDENWVEYRHLASNWKFLNGPGPDGFSSKEIHASADKAGLGMVAADESLMNLRKQFGAEIVG
jgi:ribosomal protein S27E